MSLIKHIAALWREKQRRQFALFIIYFLILLYKSVIRSRIGYSSFLHGSRSHNDKDNWKFSKILAFVETYSESTSPILYIIIFQKCQSLEPPSSTPGEDKHMHPLTFSYGI